MNHPRVHRHNRRPALVLTTLGLVLVLLATGAIFPSVCIAGSVSTAIAVKLAPDTHLVGNDDGTVAVARDWGPPNTEACDPNGLPLVVTGTVGGLGVTLLGFSDEQGPGEAASEREDSLRKLALTPGVLWVDAGSPISACLVPNDPWYPPVGTSIGQWGLARVGLPAAWDITTGLASVQVAFLDTGLNRDIADFSGRIVSPYSALTDSSVWPAWQDNDGHGSAVAAVAAARGNDGWGIAGAAWNVGIMPVKISESGDSDTLILAEAIDYAVDHGADVINISFATPPGVGPGQTLTEAVRYAIRKGVTVVAAAGNDGGPVSYPAALDDVIAVGATTSSNTRWVKSDHGSNTGTGLDVVAPGAEILSYYPLSTTLFTDDYAGTSLACPLVSGIAALMLSKDSSLSPAEVDEILTSTAKDLGTSGWDAEYGAGLVDAAAAVADAAGISTTSTTTTTSTTSSTSTTTTTSLPSTTTTTIPFPEFADVSEETTPYWYEIGYLASQEIVAGTGDGLFHPSDALLRQQFAKIIVLTLNYSVTDDSTCPFVDVQDVADDLYPYHYVAAAYTAGITVGTTPDHFSPYRTLTRAQLITMVARAAQLPEPPSDYVTSFLNFSAVHYPWARKAEYAGLLSRLVGMGYHYDFNAPASRGEVCALLYSLLK
jgi:subtilisin family serine protease